jgi:hypothetical protein
MMKRLTYIFILGAVLGTGCSKLASDKDMRICMSVNIGSLDTDTKTAANAVEFTQKDISSQRTFCPTLWFSLTKGNFSANPKHDNLGETDPLFPCHTTIELANTDPKYVTYKNIPLVYPHPNNSGDKTVYCAGFYPQDNWETGEYGRYASHIINGSEDLMFAPIISGDWNNRLSTTEDKIQRYEHLLTWIKINVCATTLETGRQWGSITKVEVESADSVIIDLRNNNGTISYSHSVQPVEGENQGHYITSFDDADGKELSLISLPVGSIFCSPATNYNIKITMKDGISRTVNVKLTDIENGDFLKKAEDSRGKLFIINLYFKPFDIVEGKSSLYYWNNKNEELYLQ